MRKLKLQLKKVRSFLSKEKKNLIIRTADNSEEYVDESVEDSDDEKKLFKAEARAGRKLRQNLARRKRLFGQGNGGTHTDHSQMRVPRQDLNY